MVDFAKANFLQPLDSRIDGTPDYDAADFFKPLTDIATVDGVKYGVPFYNYALGYLYNTDDLAQAKLPVPTTLDELVSTSKALKVGDRAGIAMQPQRGYKIFEEWGNWLFAAGGSIYGPDGKPTLNTPQAKQALNAYIDTYKTAAPPNSLNWAFDEAFRSVSSGQAASMISYNWNLPALNAARLGTVGGQVQAGRRSPAASRCSARGVGRSRPTPVPPTRRGRSRPG